MSLRKICMAIACLTVASPAYAHFKLMQPANWTSQTDDGSPQKTAPCGNEGKPANSGPIREYKAGDTITIDVDETVSHPGHYRVSLAADQASLPADPDKDVVPTAPGAANCKSLAINPSPTLPLIADGLLAHSGARNGLQTMQVKLPAGMTCDHCVLQVVEFMSSHGAPCFYHHCANIKITTTGPVGGGPVDAGVSTDGGTSRDAGGVGTGGNDAGVDGNSGGGGCSVTGTGFAGSALLTLLAGLALLRRRRAS